MSGSVSAFRHADYSVSHDSMELELCLDHPLLYCRAPHFGDEATYQDSHLFSPSMVMQPVQWDKLRQLNNNQSLGLIQLLYKAAITLLEENRRLERDLSKVQLEHQQDPARWSAVMDSEDQHRVEQDKRYQALQKLIVDDSKKGRNETWGGGLYP